jgi:ribonuclease P protein component
MTAMAGEDRQLRRLTKRSEFVRAARGKRTGRSGFSLQAVPSEADVPGIGFTVTKAMGNAPARNRIKRRLREAARACAPAFRPQHDYVLVGRREALSEPFARLVGNLGAAIGRLHEQRSSRTDSETP